MAEKNNELFEFLVKITGDNSVAKKTLQDLKKEAKDLDKQLQGMKLGSKEFEALKIKSTNLKAAISALERPTDKFTRSTKSASATAMNLSRVIQDMPYGLMGVANNVDVLQESFIRLRNEKGSVKGALSALMGALTGPTGIMLGVSAVTALAVAFGDDLWNAISGVSGQADEFIRKLDTIAGYTPIDLDIRIHGLEGLEKVEAQIEQERERMRYLQDLEKERALVEETTPSFWARLLTAGSEGGSPATRLVYEENIQALKTVRANQAARAERIRAGETTLGSIQADVEAMQEYLDLQEEEARVIAEKNASKIRMTKLQIERDNESKDLAEEEARKAEIDQKKAQAAAKRLAAAHKRREKARQKAVDDALKAEELVYTSMISNIETMIIDDMVDLEIAMQGLQSGPIGERYNALIAVIDEKVPTIVDDLIRKELQAVRNKLVRGEALTKANQDFLAQHGGITKYEAVFLGGVNRARGKVVGAGEYLDKGLKTFDSYRAELDEYMGNIGARFEDTAVHAFSQSVSLFSSQLATAIIQGGYSFSEILTNVANTFGQMLLQFIIEAFAKDIVSSLIPFFAEGTAAAPPGFAWVGERGPELVRFQGGEEVVPNNQVGRRLDALYNAGLVAQDFGRSGDVSSIINALDRQTRAMLKDRLNYEITDRGSRQIARATKKRESQIKRYTGS